YPSGVAPLFLPGAARGGAVGGGGGAAFGAEFLRQPGSAFTDGLAHRRPRLRSVRRATAALLAVAAVARDRVRRAAGPLAVQSRPGGGMVSDARPDRHRCRDYADV